VASPRLALGVRACRRDRAIHLDLYLTGYRSIPTIGWLFLLQVITAFGLAVLMPVTRNRFVAAGGAGFSVSTLAAISFLFGSVCSTSKRHAQRRESWLG